MKAIPLALALPLALASQSLSTWFVPQVLQTAGYSAQFRDEGCHGAPPCAVLSAPASPPAGTFGNLMQSFDATPYRGQTVRLRAWIKLEAASPALAPPSATSSPAVQERRPQGDLSPDPRSQPPDPGFRSQIPDPGFRAQLWLRVDLPNRQLGFFDNMGDRPITSSDWQPCEIVGEVASNAEVVNIGVMSFGKARVWIGGVVFETLPVAAGNPEVATARAAIEQLYARIDAAYAKGDVDTIASLALPGAQIHMGTTTLSLSSALVQVAGEIRKGSQYTSRSAITNLRLMGGDATVTVNNESTLTAAEGRQTLLSYNRDTWTKTAAGWKLKESALISTRSVVPPTDAETAAPVVAELKQRAVPLNTMLPDDPLDDLAAFGKAVGEARIVALGEATHGTREFFQLKHRLLEYLVKEKGFTVFAIEANWPEALAVDRYIKTGEGDPRAALAGMYFWTWNTQEVLDMILWMRRFNQAPGSHPTLTFTSFDMQTAHVAARRVLDYLGRYSPDDAGPAAASYAGAQDLEARRAQIYDDQAQGLATRAASVAAMLDAKRAALIHASSPEAWRDARQAAAIVVQACTMRVPGKGSAYRDQMMAGNVEWLAREVHPKEKIVLWAHNAHVQFGGATANGKSTGAWLRERYGKQLYVVGFAFRRGQLRAVAEAGGKFAALSAYTAPPSPEGSGDAVLSAAGLPLFFLNIAGLAGDSPLARWLAAQHLFHEVGATWNTDDAEAGLQPFALSKLYDGLIFVETSHAAEGLGAP